MATSTRRPARRRTRKQKRVDAILVVVVLGLFCLVAAIRWLAAHQGVALLGGLAVGLAGVFVGGRRALGLRRAWVNRRTAPTSLAAYQAATPGQFEQQTAALCRRDGCRDVTVVGGAGDLAADVLATTPRGQRILIQCKRYQPGNRVGSEHVQRVNGTYRDIHRCDKAAIVTTSGYTRAATALAQRVGIRLYDGVDLQAWAQGGRPPWN